MISNPKRFKQWIPTVVMLYGPAGTGKTKLAETLASELDFKWMEIDNSKVKQSHVGDGVKQAKAHFIAAKKMQPMIIFLDECESILQPGKGDGSQAQDEIIAEFKKGVDPGLKGQRVLMILATNYPWEIEGAFFSRMQHKLYVPLPTAKDLASLIQTYCTVSPWPDFTMPAWGVTDEEVVKLAQLAASRLFSLRDLIHACNEATSEAEFTNAATSFAVLKREFERVTVMCTQEQIDQYENFAKIALKDASPPPSPAPPPPSPEVVATLQQQVQQLLQLQEKQAQVHK